MSIDLNLRSDNLWKTIRQLPLGELKKKLKDHSSVLIPTVIKALENAQTAPPSPSALKKILINLPQNYAKSRLGTRLLNAVGQTQIFSATRANQQQLKICIATALRNHDSELACKLIELSPAELDNDLFREAIEHDNLQAIKVYLSRNADPKTKTANGKTALHTAVEKKDAETVEMLLAKGADPQASYDGCTTGDDTRPIFAALDSPKILNMLIEAGADVNCTRSDELTPLHICAIHNFASGAETLLRHGAPIDQSTPSAHILTPLSAAIFFGSCDTAFLLMEYGADVFGNHMDGLSTLRLAEEAFIKPVLGQLYKNFPSVLKLLKKCGSWDLFKRQFLERATEILAKTVKEKANPLELVLYMRSRELWSVLKTQFTKDQINSFIDELYERLPRYRRYLFVLCLTGDKANVQRMLHLGVDINAIMIECWVDFQYFCRNHPDTAELLINNGLDWKIRGPVDNNTLLHITASTSGKLLEQFLLANPGIDVNVENNKGNTPLHLAVKANEDAAAKHLIACGANLIAKNDRGYTPVTLAIKHHRNKILEMIFSDFDYLSKLFGMHPRELANETIHLVLLSEYKHLLNPKNRKPGSTVLEIPLLLSHPRLAACMIQKMTENEFNREIDFLSRKYGEKPLEFIRLSAYSFIPEHMLKRGENQDPFDEAINIKIAQLQKEFEKINFIDKAKPGFRDPLDYSSSDLARGLKKLLESVRTRDTSIMGLPVQTPSATKNYYRLLEQLLKHITRFVLSSNDIEEKTSCLLELADAGLHCAGRWMGTSHQLYQIYVCKQLPLTFEEHIHAKLLELRSLCFERLVEDNPHLYNSHLGKIGSAIGIPGADLYNEFEDPLADDDLNKTELMVKFCNLYHQAIIAHLKTELNAMYHDPNTRDLLLNGFIDNMPHEWGMEEFGLPLKLAEGMKKRKASNQGIIHALRTKGIHCPKEVSPQLFLEKSRGMKYLEAEVFESTPQGDPTDRIKTEAILHVLQKIGVIEPQPRFIVQNSTQTRRQAKKSKIT